MIPGHAAFLRLYVSGRCRGRPPYQAVVEEA